LSHKARKRFGQNFLHDQAVIEHIINAIHPQPGEHIVEIGPGLGALTVPLLKRTKTLHAIELDRDVIPLLEDKTQNVGELIIHQADVLQFDFARLRPATESPPHDKLRIAGNLPYNISTPLLFHLTQYKDFIQDMHFMLQFEVVKRITAAPGNKDYGRLSVMMQYYFRCEFLFKVSPGSFKPAPKVDSAIVRLIPHPQAPVNIQSIDDFSSLVKQAFMYRRKTLRNNLKELLSNEQIQSCDIDPSQRAETLSLAEFAALSMLI